MKDDLEVKSGNAKIVWKQGVDLEVKDECEETRVMFELDEFFNNGLIKANHWFHFGKASEENNGREIDG